MSSTNFKMHGNSEIFRDLDEIEMPDHSIDEEDDWEDMEEEEEDISQKISKNTLVLEQVFNYLSIPELLNCRLVCKLWNTTALLQNQLGSKSLITLNKSNIESFVQISERASRPFCRKFYFKEIDLDEPQIMAFNKVFRRCLTSLSFNCCFAVSPNQIAELMKAPNLKEIRISGMLPDVWDNSNMFFRKRTLDKLSSIELSSSGECGHIGPNFMKKLLQQASSLHTISIGQSSTLWNGFVDLIGNVSLKVNRIRLFNLDIPLKIEDFIQVFQRLRLNTITFENCIIWQHFLQSFLEIVGNNLQSLSIRGAQHEILSNAFSGMNNLSHLTLPIDGVSNFDGSNMLNSLQNLRKFSVVGLLVSTFKFNKQRWILFTIYSNSSEMQSRNSSATGVVLVAEKRREFHKVISLLPGEPLKLELDLPELDSRGVRKIFQFSGLEELVVRNNSRQCLDGWTGIPIRTCRKIAASRSFGVVNYNSMQRFPSLSTLKKLRRLEISIADDPPKKEFTLIYVLYGICQLNSLGQLYLNNFTVSDVALLSMKKCLQLTVCSLNGSCKDWESFTSHCESVKIKSFLLPQRLADKGDTLNPLQNYKILDRIFSFLDRSNVHELRKVSMAWYAAVKMNLHQKCDQASMSLEIEKYLEESRKLDAKGQHTPNKTPREVLTDFQSSRFSKALSFLRDNATIHTLIIRGLNKSMLEYFQRENSCGISVNQTCQDRRRIIYWFYPDGNDDLFVTKDGQDPNSLTLIGSWGKKDTGLLSFIDPLTNVNSVVFHGLLQEVYDLILPKLTAMKNIESVTIIPFSSDSVSEICRNHMQILSHSTFSLKHLYLYKLQVAPDVIADLVKSHRYTLETLCIQNHVNVSDRLSFSIPNLRQLQLDEPPGVLLWSTLNINQSLESIHFERSGYVFNQIKNKSTPRLDLEDEEFHHSATNMLCDVNLFLETVANRRPGSQKSILQEGSDCALRFISHFRFLSSLTLRSVHAHYGIPKWIFRSLPQLEKLVFVKCYGITDEILTGFSKDILDKMDLLNPLHFKKLQNGVCDFSNPSIRDLKNLEYLSIDDQTNCTDFSVLFGILKLKRLQYFSCKKWKITDVSIRAIADMTSIKNLITDGCTNVSSYGIEYLKNKSKRKSMIQFSQ